MKWFNRFRVFDKVDWFFFLTLCACNLFFVVGLVSSVMSGSGIAVILALFLVLGMVMTVRAVNYVTEYRLTREELDNS